MIIKNQKDFCAGVLFVALGAFAVAVAGENSMGSLNHMGPAYFPTILGTFLAAIGAVISVLSLVMPAEDAGGGRLEHVSWGVLIFVLGSVAVFAMTLLWLGLIAALALMIVISSLANPDWRPKEILIITAVLCVLCWGVFIWAVGMNIPVLPVFFN